MAQQPILDQLREIARDVSNIDKVLPVFGEIFASSIEENFAVGGRYGGDEFDGGTQKWIVLSPGRIKQRQRAGSWPGQILVEDGDLASSVSWSVTGSVLEIGTNNPYGEVHHKGATIKIPAHKRKIRFKRVKRGKRWILLFASKRDTGKQVLEKEVDVPAYTVTLPARPWLVIQNSDIEEAIEVLVEYKQKGL